MHITAKTSKSFFFRMVLLAVFSNGCTLWFLYDGTVTYPRHQEQAVKYHEFMVKVEEEKDKEKKDLIKQEQKEKWEAYATEKGWPTEDPGKPKHEAEFYHLSDSIPLHIPQYIFGGIVAPFGLLFLIIVIRARGRWIELNESGIRTSGGKELKFEQIIELDKKKWDSKGIAKIIYDNNGRKRRVVLDDCKYDVKPTRDILVEVEEQIGYDKISGGRPEAAKQAQSEPEEQAEESTE